MNRPKGEKRTLVSLFAFECQCDCDKLTVTDSGLFPSFAMAPEPRYRQLLSQFLEAVQEDSQEVAREEINERRILRSNRSEPFAHHSSAHLLNMLNAMFPIAERTHL